MVFLSLKVDGNMTSADYWKVLFWSFREWEIRYFFEPKSWWKDNIYRLLKSSCFDLFGNGKCGLFLSQKVDGKMIFTDYWKGLVLNFSLMGNTFFFESRIWWKDDIHWLLRSSSFELFGDRKYSLFFSQKIDGKIFTWSFWAFHDIPRLRKYGFSRSDLCYRNWETRWKGPLFTNGHTSEGVNNWQFFSRYRVIVVKLKECKIK